MTEHRSLVLADLEDCLINNDWFTKADAFDWRSLAQVVEIDGEDLSLSSLFLISSAIMELSEGSSFMGYTADEDKIAMIMNTLNKTAVKTWYEVVG